MAPIPGERRPCPQGTQHGLRQWRAPVPPRPVPPHGMGKSCVPRQQTLPAASQLLRSLRPASTAISARSPSPQPAPHQDPGCVLRAARPRRGRGQSAWAVPGDTGEGRGLLGALERALCQLFRGPKNRRCPQGWGVQGGVQPENVVPRFCQGGAEELAGVLLGMWGRK